MKTEKACEIAGRWAELERLGRFDIKRPKPGTRSWSVVALFDEHEWDNDEVTPAERAEVCQCKSKMIAELVAAALNEAVLGEGR